ncbi:cell division protein FtsQ/DivIB [Corynebacterium sp. UBA2622]|uniref:cell division protein FtsQ/DivIB n=1 Tax=Corynebacterium sp. UBA2622 TaxID=1946393 RepID=UPI0025BE8545|nr:FtsQ-type POTRA domain-containing protein [Corynebacterium sp. UBA2622]
MSTAYTPQPPRGRHNPGETDDERERPEGKRGPRRPQGRDARPVAVRRRRRLAAALGGVVLAGAVAGVIPFTPAMPVKSIDIQGTSRLTPSEVEEAAGVAEGTPMARVNMRSAASGVAQMPWVKSATVKRHWPSAIDVNVVENVAVAYVKGENGSGAHLIDAEGREFTVDTPPPGAIELTGSALGDDRVRGDAVAVATSISERARGRVRSIEASGPYTFRLKLDDDRTVVWGASEDNANKALALESVMEREGREFNISNPELVTVR